jgi:hypothetical protein
MKRRPPHVALLTTSTACHTIANETVYCTKVQPTGSLFPQDVCYTPQQLETLRAQQKKAADRLLTKPTGCRGQDCVTGGQ